MTESLLNNTLSKVFQTIIYVQQDLRTTNQRSLRSSSACPKATNFCVLSFLSSSAHIVSNSKYDVHIPVSLNKLLGVTSNASKDQQWKAPSREVFTQRHIQYTRSQLKNKPKTKPKSNAEHSCKHTYNKTMFHKFFKILCVSNSTIKL